MNREHEREPVMNERAAGGATCVAAAFSARFRHSVAVLSRLSLRRPDDLTPQGHGVSRPWTAWSAGATAWCRNSRAHRAVDFILEEPLHTTVIPWMGTLTPGYFGTPPCGRRPVGRLTFCRGPFLELLTQT